MIAVLHSPKKVPAELVFEAGNYLDGVTGAIYVRLGRSTVYLHNHAIVGVSVGDVMYACVPDSRNPSANKRVKEAMHNRRGMKRTVAIEPTELREKVGDAIMLMATKLIDRRLRNEG